MNRPLFRLTGVVALVLMVPYFFSAIPLFGYLFFGGMVIGILWCMFAIEYRGGLVRSGGSRSSAEVPGGGAADPADHRNGDSETD